MESERLLEAQPKSIGTCVRQYIRSTTKYVMGTNHLDHLMAEFIEHYNRERPHSAIDNRQPVGRPPPLRLAGSGEVRCRERLGGVLRHYYRKAA